MDGEILIRFFICMFHEAPEERPQLAFRNPRLLDCQGPLHFAGIEGGAKVFLPVDLS
jgi:hypothetical protein